MSTESDNVKAIVAANNQFTTNLFAQISKPDENVIFSPLSIHTILSLLREGSKNKTEVAFKNVLNLPDKKITAEAYHEILEQLNKLPNVALEVANKIYLKEGYELRAQFHEVATKHFFAAAEIIEFAHESAAPTINKWVEARTNSKIQNLLKEDDLDESTRMVLLNAVYFKGDWKDKFDTNFTSDDQFYVDADSPVPCKMMHRTGNYNYQECLKLNAKIIEIPYKNTQIAMVIMLPNEKHQIDDLEKKMVTCDLNELLNRMGNVKVNLSLPRFKMEVKVELNNALKEMGLGDAFGDEADFSGLLESPESLKISKVLHKAFIEVNEEGAEAAAATCVIMKLRCAPMRIITVDFRADHPFIFYIVWKSGDNVIELFHGKLLHLVQ